MDRDTAWLTSRVQAIWQKHFADIPQDTLVKAQWGQRSYRRLGSIILKHSPSNGAYSLITISSLLRDPEIPTLLVDQIIAHEIVHYVHGFGSERKRHLRHPHQGGVIVKEFQKRGLWELYRYYHHWMKVNWVAFLKSRKI